MPNPARKDEGPRSRASVKARIEKMLREGHRPKGLAGSGPGAVQAAAIQAVAEGEFETEKGFAGAAYALSGDWEPDWSLYVPPRRQMPQPRAVLYPAEAPLPELYQPSGTARRVLVIGDLHQDPRHEHRLAVLTWIARYASEQGFERIIQIGDWSTFDWSTFDCASTHDKPDSMAARFKPGFKDDLANLTASHQAFRLGMGEGYRPKLDFLMGNHENRLERWENAHPESAQTFTLARDETFAQFGWRTRPYGELHYVEGVAFAHHATNGAGRAFGGETGPQRAANKSTVPVVGGHTHRKQLHDAAKIGPLDVISMVEVGCAMPWGEIESYLGHGTPSGWWWGVVPMTLQGGLITDIEFKSMLSIRSRYSDDGSDIRAA